MWLTLAKILLYALVILWGGLAVFAYRTVRQTIRKYRDIKPVEEQEKWKAFMRHDWNKWDERGMLIGAFFRFPLRILAVLYISVTALLLFTFTPRGFQKFFIRLVLQRVINLVFKIESKGGNPRLTTPIVICNHVNWFDIVYCSVMYFPLSFVSKESVNRVPLVGGVARGLQCIFLDRRSESARNDTVEKIKKRAEDYARDPEGTYPVLIYPEGTTTNGRSIARFKTGAFNPLAPITIFGLEYSCEGFEMGMDEVTPPEHMVLSMCLRPKVAVERRVIEAKAGETVEEYMGRAQQVLSEMTNYRIFDAGFTEKCQLTELREQLKNE